MPLFGYLVFFLSDLLLAPDLSEDLPEDFVAVGFESDAGLDEDLLLLVWALAFSDLPDELLLADLSDLSALTDFVDLSSLAVLPFEFLSALASDLLVPDLAAGFSGVSATFTGVLSFNSASGAAAGADSAALSLSTSSGWPGLPSDFIETPFASWSCARDILNLLAIRSGFSPGWTV